MLLQLGPWNEPRVHGYLFVRMGMCISPETFPTLGRYQGSRG